MSKDKMFLTDVAIAELEKLLRDSDKKIRLRAISLILRHGHKARQQHVLDDELSQTLDSLLQSLERD